MALLRGVALGFGCFGIASYVKVLHYQSELPKTQLLLKTSKNASGHVIVIGAGCTGASTAHRLALKGYAVTVLESGPGPALESTSCAAGGMQRSNPVFDKEKWQSVTRCFFPSVSSWFFGESKGHFDFFQISLLETFTDPHFIRWLTGFTYSCLFGSNSQSSRQSEMLKFTVASIDELKAVLESGNGKIADECGYNKRGVVKMLYSEDNQTPDNHSKNTFEPSKRIYGDSIFTLEPSLRHVDDSLVPVAVNYEYEAVSADPERFTSMIVNKCLKDPDLNVQFLFNTKVEGIDTINKQGTKSLSEIRTNKGVIRLDSSTQVVVAAGSWTPKILAHLSLYCPIYPLKGYCVPFSAPEDILETDLPTRIVCDSLVFTTRLGNEIRVTSVGEFSGWKTVPNQDVDARFRSAIMSRMPQLRREIESNSTRIGLRPFVADGVALIGRVEEYSNLLVNSPPGFNGWKTCEGAGELIARIVNREEADAQFDFDWEALSPKGRVQLSPLFTKICLSRWEWS